MSSEDRFWTTRLRWRLRGAMQWPAFVVLTLLDGLVLDLLPPVATTGVDFIQGVLIAAFGNLFIVGVLAPFLSRRLAARRLTADLPTVGELDVLQDRLATALLGLGLVATIVSGLANRPLIVSETRATERNAELVREYVGHSGDEQLRRNLETANTIKQGDGYFRTCIASDDRRHFTCLLVDTKKDPPRVRRDPSGESNARLAPP